jgi:hypothetical protein
MSRASLPLVLFVLAALALPAGAAPRLPAPRLQSGKAPAAAPISVPGPVAAQPLPPIDSVPRPVEAGFIQTVSEKPRLAIVFDGQPRELNNQLARNLEATRRFAVVSAPASLVGARSRLGPGITPAVSQSLRKSANVDMVLRCDVRDAAGELKASMRLLDLRNGDVSRELAAFGRASTVGVLAKQLATFVRRAAPLRCYVRALNDDGIVLDLGSADGMAAGATFQVVRHPQNLKPLEVGLVRVTTIDAYTARAEVESTGRGLTVAPGDVAIEQTGEMALN